MKLEDLYNNEVISTYTRIIVSVSDQTGASIVIFKGTLRDWSLADYLMYKDYEIHALSGHQDYLNIMLEDAYV